MSRFRFGPKCSTGRAIVKGSIYDNYIFHSVSYRFVMISSLTPTQVSGHTEITNR